MQSPPNLRPGHRALLGASCTVHESYRKKKKRRKKTFPTLPQICSFSSPSSCLPACQKFPSGGLSNPVLLWLLQWFSLFWEPDKSSHPALTLPRSRLLSPASFPEDKFSFLWVSGEEERQYLLLFLPTTLPTSLSLFPGPCRSSRY